jgi:hypothetical protein
MTELRGNSSVKGVSVTVLLVVFLFKQKEEYKPYPVQPPAPEQKVNMVQSTPQQPTPEDYRNFDIVRAAQYGATERCIELVEAGFDVNQPDAENVTVLHWAAINNRSDIVRYAKVITEIFSRGYVIL